ncbi:hypothetical protein BJ742DRAFT_832597 [Cladochytrium replicatum]|nr:hypothetical protein BJ742DRAFT_832597 [Cladochytrium replicatum]
MAQTLPIELLLISKIHTLVPAFSSQKLHHIPADSEATPLLIPSKQDNISKKSIFDQLVLYFRHPVFLASLSIYTLYFTVLSFYSVMLAFLLVYHSHSRLCSWRECSNWPSRRSNLAVSHRPHGARSNGVAAVWSQVLSRIPAVFALWMRDISSDDKSGSDWRLMCLSPVWWWSREWDCGYLIWRRRRFWRRGLRKTNMVL